LNNLFAKWWIEWGGDSRRQANLRWLDESIVPLAAILNVTFLNVYLPNSTVPG
jgi:hypothetical protein